VNDGRGDQVMRELAQALAVEPSPDFAARVRAAAAEAPRRRWLPASLVWAAAAVAAGVVIMVVAMPGGPLVLMVRPGPAEVASRAPVAPAPPRVALTRESAAAPATLSASSASRERGRRTPAARAVHVASSHEPAVLVPDDERRALDRLLSALASGQVDPRALPSLSEDPTVPISIPAATPPAPLAIQPLVDTTGGNPHDSTVRAVR
jgi:hypothetical protein